MQYVPLWPLIVQDCQEWISEHQLYAEILDNFLIVVNKTDLLNSDQFASIKGKIEGKYHNIKIFYASAKENKNIKETFDYILGKLLI